MSETKVVSAGTATDWTDVSSGLIAGSQKALIRIENNSDSPLVSVFVRKKGDSTSPLPERLSDWSSRTILVPVNSDRKFQYKTDGTVDIWIISDATTPTANYGSEEQVRQLTGLTSSDVSAASIARHLADSEESLDNYFDRSFLNSQSVTEWFDTYEDFAQTIEGVQTGTIFMRYRPIQSVTSLEEYDTNDNLVQSYDSTKYFLYAALGQIVMRPSAISTLGVNTFVNQRRRVKIVYTYGYGTVPGYIRQLSNLLAGIYSLAEFHGLKWEAPSTTGLPNLTSSIGSIPQNINKTIELLGARYDALIKSVGRFRDDFVVI